MGRDAISSSQRANIGPFPLPPDPGFDTGPRKKWGEMRGKEKVGAVFTQMGAFVIVIFGGGLFVLIMYATGSELISPNSPTRVFEDCVERVKANPEINALLLPPMSFYSSPIPSSFRRSRRVSSAQNIDPTTGQDILLVKFYIQAGSIEDANKESYWQSFKRYVGPLIYGDAYTARLEYNKQAKQAIEEKERMQAERAERGWSGWAVDEIKYIFGGLVGVPTSRSATTGSLMSSIKKPTLGEFTTGEAIAQLKRDPVTRNFVYQQLYVDIPDSQHPHRYRVYIPTDVYEKPTVWNKLRVHMSSAQSKV